MLLKVQMGTDESTIQHKITMPKELDERLKVLASRYGKKSGQAVVMELIDIYLPVWIGINDSMNRATQHQLGIIEEEFIKNNKKKAKKVKAEKPDAEKLNFSGKKPSKKPKSNEDKINEQIDKEIEKRENGDETSDS